MNITRVKRETDDKRIITYFIDRSLPFHMIRWHVGAGRLYFGFAEPDNPNESIYIESLPVNSKGFSVEPDNAQTYRGHISFTFKKKIK